MLPAGCCLSDDCDSADPEDCNEDLLEYSEYQNIYQSMDIGNYSSVDGIGESVPENGTVLFANYNWNYTLNTKLFAQNMPNGEGELVCLDDEPLYCIPSGDASYWLEQNINIDNIIVQTKFDFNEDYAAGDNINDLIFLEMAGDLIDHLDLPATERPSNVLYDYTLKEKPTAGSSFAPIMTLVLSDGNEFSAEGTAAIIE